LYTRNGIFGLKEQMREIRTRRQALHRAAQTTKYAEFLPQQAPDIHDKSLIAGRTFERELRARLRGWINPEIIEEHRRSPLGQHSDHLERILNYFRKAPISDKYAVYTEDGEAYVRNVDRLLRKFETAKTCVPAPKIKPASRPTKTGALFFGTTASPSYEALEILEEEGYAIDTLRLRAFPFTREVEQFLTDHDTVFVIEQNRDGQMRRLLLNESNAATREKLVSVLNYDGLPITARHIAGHIRTRLGGANVTSIARKRSGSARSKA
jgi:hypothetical protein